MSQPTLIHKPELLAPAGTWDCARAAVANGADAIYFGMPKFNARMRAENFTAEDLPKLMEFLHSHGVKGYATFNVLIFTDELDAALAQLRLMEESEVDAAIIQDLGLALMAQRAVPNLKIHASTQMTLTSPEGVAFAKRLGVERVVLARELSLRELAKFVPYTGSEGDPAQPGLPIEIFVHGALCVAYSGQCLTSEALGQRSANRGECAQACRMPYEMIVDGEHRDLGDKRYLLSPQDLAAAEEIPALMKLGIRSFKIEGRLKTPEYVSAVCQVYRRAIDSAWAALQSDVPGTIHVPETSHVPGTSRVPASAEPTYTLPERDRYMLEMAFSRGLYRGWMQGVNHQELVHARYGKKRGALLGTVKSLGRNNIEVSDIAQLAPGDGVVFESGGDTENETGGRVYEIRGNRLFFENGRIDFARIRPGDRIFKTDDPRLNRELRRTFECELPPRPLALHWRVQGTDGQPLTLTASVVDRPSLQWTGASTMPLQPALQRPLTAEVLAAQLGRLGGTSFVSASVESTLPAGLILPVSELNRLRRAAAEALTGQLATSKGKRANASASPPAAVVETASWRRIAASAFPDVKLDSKLAALSVAPPHLSVLCRTPDQVQTALTCGVASIYCDFEDIRRYKDAVAVVRDANASAPATKTRVYLATPRIQKAGEQGYFRLIEGAEPDGVLIRNLGALDYFRASPLERIGDFSLNVANPLTAAILMREGLGAVTVSYDLNAVQVGHLVAAAPAGWFEITLHQHMPMFHMEHCVFAAFLSSGTDYTNCGRPCDTHHVEIRDRVGMEHPVKADVGCRNTVYHGRSQSGAGYLAEFRSLGVRRFRVELLLEDKARAERVIRGYQSLLAGQSTPGELFTSIQAENKLGVTLGPLAVVER
ncbi:peptidase U32 [Verrucomicrobia bacterium LW23]|nr:peptidase U32 [Verrucomicrobia bacterium LW23]